MTATRPEFRNAIGRVVTRWWKGLGDDRGTRASLRRAGSITEVFGIPGFHHDLLRPVEENLQRPVDDAEAERLAVVAAVLAHVEQAVSGRSSPAAFGRYLGSSKKGEQPRISGLRFRRLLAIDNQETLLRTMIRVVHLLDKTSPVVALASVLAGWDSDQTRRALAIEYYAAAPIAA
jgi:CRISPR system Cascade subunit CasB